MAKYSFAYFVDRVKLAEAPDEDSAFKLCVDTANSEIPEGYDVTRYGFKELTDEEASRWDETAERRKDSEEAVRDFIREKGAENRDA